MGVEMKREVEKKNKFKLREKREIKLNVKIKLLIGCRSYERERRWRAMLDVCPLRLLIDSR